MVWWATCSRKFRLWWTPCSDRFAVRRPGLIARPGALARRQGLSDEAVRRNRSHAARLEPARDTPAVQASARTGAGRTGTHGNVSQFRRGWIHTLNAGVRWPRVACAGGQPVRRTHCRQLKGLTPDMLCITPRRNAGEPSYPYEAGPSSPGPLQALQSHSPFRAESARSVRPVRHCARVALAGSKDCPRVQRG